jgi:hypothetical protein
LACPSRPVARAVTAVATSSIAFASCEGPVAGAAAPIALTIFSVAPEMSPGTSEQLVALSARAIVEAGLAAVGDGLDVAVGSVSPQAARPTSSPTAARVLRRRYTRCPTSHRNRSLTVYSDIYMIPRWSSPSCRHGDIAGVNLVLPMSWPPCVDIIR